MLDVRIKKVLPFRNVDGGKACVDEKMRRAYASHCELWLIILKKTCGWKKYYLLPKLLGLPIDMFGKGYASTGHVSSIITLSGIRYSVCMLMLLWE